MRIFYASLVHLGSRQANIVQIQQMCSAFSSKGNDVILTGIGPPSQRRPGEYRTCLLPWPFVRLRMRLMRVLVRSVVKRWRADLVYTRTPLLAESAMIAGCPAVLELHEVPNASSETAASLRRIWRAPNLRRIVTISQLLADDLFAEYGPPHAGCDIVVAHDGAAAGPRPGPSPVGEGALRVGYFGHLYPGKGMEMIAQLAPALPEMRFEVYGGTEGDIARWRRMTAGQANLTLHGHVHHGEVAGRMADCDILIAPYSSSVSHAGKSDIGRWMSPLKLFEYMAAERPIVTSDLPVLREVLRDGESALLCPPDDVDAFAAALRRLAGNAALRQRLGAAGRNLLEAEYTWERRVDHVLEGIIPRSGTGR